MMLQGHFIDTLMAIEYKDSSKLAFQIWSYFRGITAPTFFTISGLIFTYLLIRAKKQGRALKRMKKGLLRGLMLLAIGYSLRVPIFEWLKGHYNSYFLVVDVLQCIGLSIIIIVLLYQLLLRKTLLFSLVTLVLGLMIFLTEPLYRFLDVSSLPLAINNYLSKAHGSIFTIIPWLGYFCFGAFLSTIFYRYLDRKNFKIVLVISLFIVGSVLIWYSSTALMKLYYYFDAELFKSAAYYNYLFTRLGNVLILIGLFYTFEKYIKTPLILKVGQNTLSIYVIHFIVIYGSFTGFGLSQIIGKTLNPIQAIFGASLFLLGVCFLSFHYMKPNVFIYRKTRQFIDKLRHKEIIEGDE